MSARRTLLRLDRPGDEHSHDFVDGSAEEVTVTRYEPASSSPTATRCQTGTLALAGACKAVYPELTVMRGAYGCFNRRRIEGTTSWSLHAEGRALDVGVPDGLNHTGWVFACEITRLHAVIDVQRVIWDGHIWSIEAPAEWRRLQPGVNQHSDHCHLEQRWAGALKPLSVMAPWTEVLKDGRPA